MNKTLFESFVLESTKNFICDNSINSTLSCVTARNFLIIFRCIHTKTLYNDHYNFSSPELDGRLPLNFAR